MRSTLRPGARSRSSAPVARTPGGRRAYSDDDVAWLRFVRCLRDTGMPISRLKRYAELSADPATMRDRLALLEEHARDVELQIEELRTQQIRLREKIGWYLDQLAEAPSAQRPERSAG